jgi:hypothetical protein
MHPAEVKEVIAPLCAGRHQDSINWSLFHRERIFREELS